MTGREFINWIKENKAEDYEIRITDSYGKDTPVEPSLAKERTWRWTGDGKREMIEKYFIDL